MQIPRTVLSSALTLALTIPFQQTFALTCRQEQSARPICDEQRALMLIHQQVEDTKALDDEARRVAVLIRAADLLWPGQEETARDYFTRAFEAAEKHFQERGDDIRKDGNLTVEKGDQQFSVLRAIARRDSAWAKRIAERIAEETRRDAEKAKLDSANAATSAPKNDSVKEVAQNTLDLAISLIATDQKTAILLARSALGQASAQTLLRFFFKLVVSDPAASDAFYREAVTAYAVASFEDLYFLSVYPFALERVRGPAGSNYGYGQTPGLAPNAALQQLFLETLFRRIERSVNGSAAAPDAQSVRYMSEPAQMFIALNHLEPIVARHLPAYSDQLARVKALIGASLTTDDRQNAMGSIERQQTGFGSSFEGNIEKAEREKDPEKRDTLLWSALLNPPEGEAVERLIELAQKISDTSVRNQTLNYVYFKGAQKAIKDGDFEEARRLSEKVEQLDQRAYLSYQIAAESLKRLDDKQRAKEVLDETARSASKAPNTNEKARAQLGIVHLYARLDSVRAFEVLRDALYTINHIENPDFSSSNIIQRVEGKSFSSYLMISLEGFSLENIFRELAPFDFDGALMAAQSLEDKAARATAILALAASCLENLEKMKKQRPKQESPEEAKPASKKPASKKPAKPNQ